MLNVDKMTVKRFTMSCSEQSYN